MRRDGETQEQWALRMRDSNERYKDKEYLAKAREWRKLKGKIESGYYNDWYFFKWLANEEKFMKLNGIK